MKLGKDNVIIGNVSSDLEVGDGNVIIGATDVYGNTIINTAMAVGRGAEAGPDSIAIGAGARAGAVTLGEALQQLIRIAEEANDRESVALLTQINTELNKPNPDRSVIIRAWGAVNAAASIAGSYTLVQGITKIFLNI